MHGWASSDDNQWRWPLGFSALAGNLSRCTSFSVTLTTLNGPHYLTPISFPGAHPQKSGWSSYLTSCLSK